VTASYAEWLSSYAIIGSQRRATQNCLTRLTRHPSTYINDSYHIPAQTNNATVAEVSMHHHDEDTQCNFYKTKGHLARVCCSSLRQQQLQPCQNLHEHRRSTQDGNFPTNRLDHETHHCDGSNTPVTDCLPTLRFPQSVEYIYYVSSGPQKGGALQCRRAQRHPSTSKSGHRSRTDTHQ
jgi:hypothetical protein